MNDDTKALKHLRGCCYYAERKIFLKPGLYYRQRRIIAFPRLVSQPKISEFPEQTVVIAKDQPEYRPLPVHVRHDRNGEIICCWKLTIPARLKLLWTGTLWHSVWTFRQPLQPLLLLHTKPNMESTPQ
jgi:hypothetical protein